MSVQRQAHDDIEVVSFNSTFTINSGDITTTNEVDGDQHKAEGLLVIDYDEIVDRNERLILLQAHHHMDMSIRGSDGNIPSTEYGTAAFMAEIAASPASHTVRTSFPTDGSVVEGNVEGRTTLDDSIDVIGRPLSVVESQDFSESAGPGGGGGDADDNVVLEDIPRDLAEFHPRDELFLNGEFRFYNVSVEGAVGRVCGQHIYAVEQD